MPKRVIAFLVVASLALGSAGCAASHRRTDLSSCRLEGNSHGGGDLLVGLVVLPIWLAMCYSTPPGEKAAAEDWKGRAAAEKAGAEAARAAAEKGDAEAQFDLGAMYEWGKGVPRGDAEAATWYQKSADQGFGRAQLALAFIYGTGRGVGQNDVQADMWCTLAASAEKSTATTKVDAINYREFIEARMTTDQIAEARKRAQEWKPI